MFDRFTKVIKEINQILDLFNRQNLWDVQLVSQLEKQLGDLNRVIGIRVSNNTL